MGAELYAAAQVRDAMSPGTLMVLEEVAGSYGGGCENITDRFVDGFFWLHALGVTAANGFDRLHRQDIAGWSFTGGMSHYQLAGPAGWTNGSAAMTPHPDWYTSVLFNTMVGNRILNATASGAGADVLSLHAWCAALDQSFVVTFTNPTDAQVTLALAGVPDAPRNEFILTAPSLSADSVLLNGAAWSVDANGRLPALPVPGKPVASGGIVLPPYSYGFLQFPGSPLPACQ